MEFLKAHWVHGEPTGHCTGEDTPPTLGSLICLAPYAGRLGDAVLATCCQGRPHMHPTTSSTLRAATVIYQP